MGSKLLPSLFMISILFILLTAAVIAAGGGGAPIVVPKAEPKVPSSGVTPEESSAFKCSTLATIQERISCRLELKSDNELNYLPEECRALSGDKRDSCKGFYSSVQSCWVGNNRANPVACVRSQLTIGKNISAEVKACEGNATCVQDVSERVHSLAKFRIYNLEWKAEYLLEQEGVSISRELLVDLVKNLELKKQEYNNAITISEKQQVLRDARQLWQSFASKVKEKVGI